MSYLGKYFWFETYRLPGHYLMAGMEVTKRYIHVEFLLFTRMLEFGIKW